MMAHDYSAERDEALRTCAVPTDFQAWPPAEQEYLLRLAGRAHESAMADVERMSKKVPSFAAGFAESTHRLAKLCSDLRAACSRREG